MQWPNQEIQPPMKPYGPFIAVFTQRYPPPVSGNADPSSMYAIAVKSVTPKFRSKTTMSAGQTRASPGPTRRKIVVPTVGPSPIIVISRSPRSLRNRTSTSSGFFPNRYPVAMGTGVDKEARIKFVGGSPGDALDVHHGIPEGGHISQPADGPRATDPGRHGDVEHVPREARVAELRDPPPQGRAVDTDPRGLDRGLRPHPRLDRTLEGGRAAGIDRRADVLMVRGPELHARLEHGALAVTALEESRQRIGCGGHTGGLRRRMRRCRGTGA